MTPIAFSSSEFYRSVLRLLPLILIVRTTKQTLTKMFSILVWKDSIEKNLFLELSFSNYFLVVVEALKQAKTWPTETKLIMFLFYFQKLKFFNYDVFTSGQFHNNWTNYSSMRRQPLHWWHTLNVKWIFCAIGQFKQAAVCVAKRRLTSLTHLLHPFPVAFPFFFLPTFHRMTNNDYLNATHTLVKQSQLF